jgi:hypothetical protein
MEVVLNNSFLVVAAFGCTTFFSWASFFVALFISWQVLCLIKSGHFMFLFGTIIGMWCGLWNNVVICSRHTYLVCGT